MHRHEVFHMSGRGGRSLGLTGRGLRAETHELHGRHSEFKSFLVQLRVSSLVSPLEVSIVPPSTPYR